jgi:hypothetical protein
MKKKSSTKKLPGKSSVNLQATDFAGGVRGKYAADMKENGYTIRVYRRDGGFSEKRVPGESMVALEPDVQEYFPDSESVNRALRKLISLIPEKRGSASNKQNGNSQPKKRLNA